MMTKTAEELRDDIAIYAMLAILSRENTALNMHNEPSGFLKRIARVSYEMAEYMIEERENQKNI